MIKVTGLDAFSRQLTQAQQALEALGTDLCTVNFDPNDPASIEAALQVVEVTIDEKLAQYSGNSFVVSLGESMKAKYREAILDRAAAARLKGDSDNV